MATSQRSAAELRAAVSQCHDAAQKCRILAIAMVLEGTEQTANRHGTPNSAQLGASFD
jgi:hypothetical protein